MTEMQTSVKDFNSYERYWLKPERTKELTVFIMMNIFRHPGLKTPARNYSGEESRRGGSYIYSPYQYIMPDNLELPLATRRIRAFFPGYNAQEGRGFSSDDHIVGGVQVYRSSRPHFMFEIDYLRSKTRPVRNYYELIPHQNALLAAQQVAGTDQLFVEQSTPEEIETDVMTLEFWLRELSGARKGKNAYKEGMRNSRSLPGGMAFTWPLLKNDVVVRPVESKRYDNDLPFDVDEREPALLAA